MPRFTQDISWPKVAIVCCAQGSQHGNYDFVMAIGHNKQHNVCTLASNEVLWKQTRRIWSVYGNFFQSCQIAHFFGQIKVTNRSFVASGHQSSLWPKATTFLRSQRGYSWPSIATVHCGRRPQWMRSKNAFQKCRLRPTLDFKADVRRNVHCAPGGNSEISQDRVSYEIKRDNLNNLQWKFHWIRARIGSRILKTSLNLG